MTHHDFYPKRGELYIFPAALSHMVIPFHSPVERISVSGNIHFSAPILTKMPGMLGDMLGMWSKKDA